MAGEIRVVREVVVDVDGAEVLQHGSRAAPQKSVQITGTPRLVQEFQVAADAERVLWVYSAGNEWTFALVEADGSAEIRWKVDKATSSSDRTAAGTHVNWLRAKMSDYAPFILATDSARCASTVADQVNSAAGGGSMTDGYVYELRIKNLSTTTALKGKLVTAR